MQMLGMAYVILVIIIGISVEPRLLSIKAILIQAWLAIIISITNDTMFPPPKNSHSRFLQFIVTIFISGIAGAYSLFTIYIFYAYYFISVINFSSSLGISGFFGSIILIAISMIGFGFYCGIMFGIPALIAMLINEKGWTPFKELFKDDGLH